MNYDGAQLHDFNDPDIRNPTFLEVETKPGEAASRPNPEYEALLQLKEDVERDKPDVRVLLDGVAENMGNGTVWYGPQAREFSADLDGQKDQLKNRSDDLPDDVQEKLNSTPPTIPADGGQFPM